MEEEMILTPCSKTPIPKAGRWKNELYVREYHRLRHRADNPPKQRLRVCDDGTPYREKHPDKVIPYYKKREKQYCDVCGMDVYVGWLGKHQQSASHIKNLKAYERGQKAVIIADTPTPNWAMEPPRLCPIFCNSV